jgi:sorting nexin-29
MAIDKQKNNRAPGEDFIVAELFKDGGRSLLEALHKIIVSISKKEDMPKEWNTGLICPIFKKGDKLECNNYRGITPLNIAYKVLSCIILEHINQYEESVLEEYQCGFRCGRSIVEQIFIIRQLMEKCFEFNNHLHISFVDYKKAFDNINRTELLNAMGSYGIPNRPFRLIDMTIKDIDAKITIDGNVSKSFNVLQGVRQGDGLSAVLFNLALDNYY